MAARIKRIQALYHHDPEYRDAPFELQFLYVDMRTPISIWMNLEEFNGTVHALNDTQRKVAQAALFPKGQGRGQI